MQRQRTGFRSIIFQAGSLVLALIAGGGILAAGVMAAAVCGKPCCCKTVSAGGQPGAGSQTRSSRDCGCGVPLKACDFQSATPFRLPEGVPAACCEPHQAAHGPAFILGAGFSSGRNAGGNFSLKLPCRKFTLPPLYLQNQSYLI